MSRASLTGESWRFVEYHCRSCNERCLVDHAEPRAKFKECPTCWRVPELDQERLDHRESGLLWAHRLVASDAGPITPNSPGDDDRADAAASAGEAEAGRKRPPEAGADPEAGAHRRRPPGAGEREAGRKPPGVPLERLPELEGEL